MEKYHKKSSLFKGLTFYVSSINLKVVLSLEEEGDEEVLL